MRTPYSASLRTSPISNRSLPLELKKMKELIIIIVCLGILTGCKSQPDLEQVKEDIEMAQMTLSQPDAKKTLQIILNEKQLTDSLSQNIDAKNSEFLSKQKEILISECSIFIDYTTVLHNRLLQKHKTSKSSTDKKLMHERFVNEIFIENHEGSTFRNNIENLIRTILEVTKASKLKIRREGLPIKLNYDIAESGKSWEETIFRDMPAGAVLPIINKYKKDAILTKILILEELSKTYE